MIFSYSFQGLTRRHVMFQGFSGFSVRGIFFNVLKTFSSNEASNLHRRGTLSPYAVTPIIVDTFDGRHIVYERLSAGVPFRFDVRVFEESLGTALKEFIFSSDVLNMRLQNAEFALRSVRVSSVNPSSILGSAKPHRRYDVSFLTPTFFRSTQQGPTLIRKLLPRRLRGTGRPTYRYVLLPDPYYMFRNLARLYRRFGKPSFNYFSYCRWLLEGGVALETHYGLRVHKIYEESGKWSRGFTGRATFTLPEDTFDPKMAKITHALLEFARYSNVGANRTAGFGVVDYRVLTSEAHVAHDTSSHTI